MSEDIVNARRTRRWRNNRSARQRTTDSIARRVLLGVMLTSAVLCTLWLIGTWNARTMHSQALHETVVRLAAERWATEELNSWYAVVGGSRTQPLTLAQAEQVLDSAGYQVFSEARGDEVSRIAEVKLRTRADCCGEPLRTEYWEFVQRSDGEWVWSTDSSAAAYQLAAILAADD